jgi:hypothetical protein
MDLQKNWERVKTLMYHARCDCELATEANMKYEGYLSHNELELAWDILYGEHFNIRSGNQQAFLLRMLQAATLMGLDEKAEAIYHALADG